MRVLAIVGWVLVGWIAWGMVVGGLAWVLFALDKQQRYLSGGMYITVFNVVSALGVIVTGGDRQHRHCRRPGGAGVTARDG